MPNGGQFVSWDEEKQWAFNSLPLEWTNLPATGFAIDDVTSSWTINYNCIAYAAKRETQQWWPMPLWMITMYGLRYYYWPPHLQRQEPPAVERFFEAFEWLGYERCSSGRHERGYEKVAIYVDAVGNPTHMARDLGDGIWYSKLGDYQDIRHHTPEGAESVLYGAATHFMRKQLEGISLWQQLKMYLAKILRSPLGSDS